MEQEETSNLQANNSLVETNTSPLRTLLNLAWPLIVSNSFSTIQITIDRIFLSQYSPDAVSGATSAVFIFFTPFILLHCTASYISTFVAQYMGAKRPHRVGPAIWQALYFSLLAGILWMAISPLSNWMVSIAGHAENLQAVEAEYFYCLCWMAWPALIVATTSAFFSGRGDSKTVIWINLIGTVVNAVLDYLWIFGHGGFSAMGVAGAGWATVVGTWASALLGLALMFRQRYREEYGILSGWKFEWDLFRRLMKYGLPSGVQWMLDMTAFTTFMLLTEKFSQESLAASSLAITINNLAFIPMMGMGQAVAILVGQSLGADQPDKAERYTWLGFWVAATYMLAVALLYVVIPSVFIQPFASDANPEKWAIIAEQVRVLLWFVALYSLFDAVNIVFSFGLRGAGDTHFVSMVSLLLAWPLMVLPAWIALKMGWHFYSTWGFASLYIIAQATCFVVRFRGGKWKNMRVIEPNVIV